MEENFYLNYDVTTGAIKGFYLKSIHGDNIPIPNIEITPEKHDFYMQNNGKYRLNPNTLENEEIPVTTTVSTPSEPDRITALESAIKSLMEV